MSYFLGCHALVILMMLLLLCSLASGHDYFFDSSSNRDEVVHMAGYGEEKLSTVLITGSLNCEARFHNGDHHPHAAWPIPGALVAVNCHNYGRDRKGKSMVAHSVTDEFGDFMVDLPSYLHAIPNLEKICTVKVHQIPKRSLCRPTHRVNKHKGLISLSSVGNGIRTYDAGNIRIQHSTSKPLQALLRKYGGKEVIRN